MKSRYRKKVELKRNLSVWCSIVAVCKIKDIRRLLCFFDKETGRKDFEFVWMEKVSLCMTLSRETLVAVIKEDLVE